MKQTVIVKLPTYLGIRWDGDNKAEFTDALPGVSAFVDDDGTLLLVVSGAGQMVTVDTGQWAVVPASNMNLPAVTVLSDAEFTAQYRAQ